jgi:hypothetical protein
MRASDFCLRTPLYSIREQRFSLPPVLTPIREGLIAGVSVGLCCGAKVGYPNIQLPLPAKRMLSPKCGGEQKWTKRGQALLRGSRFSWHMQIKNDQNDLWILSRRRDGGGSYRYDLDSPPCLSGKMRTPGAFIERWDGVTPGGGQQIDPGRVSCIGRRGSFGILQPHIPLTYRFVLFILLSSKSNILSTVILRSRQGGNEWTLLFRLGSSGSWQALPSCSLSFQFPVL